jgi:hypothetical protein
MRQDVHVLPILLRPVLFALAIVAAVLTGDRTDSFWLGLLAFLVAAAVGRALRALVRRRTGRAVYRLIWPAAATGYAFLFAALGLPAWATFLVAIVAASLTKDAVAAAFLPAYVRRRAWATRGEWNLSRLDDLL